MKAMQYAKVIVVLVALVGATVLPAATKQEFEESTSADGLEKVNVKNVDVAYARPGMTLAPYTKVRVDPVQVTFAKNFAPERAGSRMKLTTSQLEKIRSEVATIVQDEFTKELARGSYVTTDKAGPDVLQVHADITNLYVNAPDTMEPNRTNSYTMSAGEMTLVMSLADSETGAVLARVYDRRKARETSQITWTTGVTNRAEAADAARFWAGILRARLDAARGIGKK
jgi:Protein of unknown function (DUF3313)